MPTLLREKDVEKKMNLPKKVLRKWALEGHKGKKLRHYRLGKRLGFRSKDIVQFMQDISLAA